MIKTTMKSKLLWFVVLWLAGVMTLMGIAFLIRLAL